MPRFLVLKTTAEDKIRTETLNGTDYTVVPVVALVEGVLQGANSPGPELVKAKEFGDKVATWNGRPVTMGHPIRDNGFVSAGEPSVWEKEAIGTIFNTKLDGNKLKMEAWINMDRVAQEGDAAQDIIDRLNAGEEVEISTGYFSDVTPEAGKFNGEEFIGVQTNIIPDHLAILGPQDIGACSWNDGCGAPRTNKAVDVPTLGYMIESEKDGILTGDFVPLTAKGINLPTEVGVQMKRLTFNAQNGDNFRKTLEFLRIYELSDADVREALDSALMKDIPDDFTWVVAVFSGTFVYTKGFSGLFQRDFSIAESGVVELGKDITEVRAETSFVPVELKQEEANVNKKEKLVTALIANAATKWEEGDKELLMAMEEEVLAKLDPVVLKAVEKVEPVEPVVVEPAAPAEKTPVANQTVDQYLQGAPEGIRDVITNGIRMHKEKKDALLASLTTNEKCLYSPEELGEMSIVTLEKVAKMCEVPEADYSGRGLPNLNEEAANSKFADPPPNLYDNIRNKK